MTICPENLNIQHKIGVIKLFSICLSISFVHMLKYYLVHLLKHFLCSSTKALSCSLAKALSCSSAKTFPLFIS